MPKKKENLVKENVLKESKEEKLNIDKEAIVKEIKKEVLDRLNEEIVKTVDYESKNKLDKMEKKIYKYKNASIIKRNIIIIILLGVIVFETKVLYDNDFISFINKKEETKINNEIKVDKKDNETIEKEEKDTKWYIDNFSYLLENIKTNLIGEDKYYLYKDNYTEETINNAVKLNMAYQLLDKKNISIENGVIIVKESDLKDSYNKIFGNLDNYKSENFSNNCIQFVYNKDLKKYMAIDITCDEIVSNKIEKIKTIYEEDNKIVIETIVGIYHSDNNNLSNINGEIVTENFSNNINEYEDRLNKYKYIFELKDKNYYLKEINKI